MAVIKTSPKDYAVGDWAVWPYDQYPGFLCGEIGNVPNGWADRPPVRADGAVFITSYGSYFKPKLVVDAETGKALRELQSRLGTEMAQATKLLRTEMDGRRTRAFETLGVAACMAKR